MGCTGQWSLEKERKGEARWGKKKKKTRVQLRPRGISSRSHLQKSRKRLGEVCTLRYCPGLQLPFHHSSCWLSRVVWIRHTLFLLPNREVRLSWTLTPCRLLTELLCGSVAIGTISQQGSQFNLQVCWACAMSARPLPSSIKHTHTHKFLREANHLQKVKYTIRMQKWSLLRQPPPCLLLLIKWYGRYRTS